MPTMHHCLSEGREKGHGEQGCGMGAWRSRQRERPADLGNTDACVMCSAQYEPGRAPKGKRASTLHRDREKREEADPLLKDKRLAEERAGKRRFIERLKGPSTTSSEHMSTNTDVPQSTHAPLVDTLDAPSHAPVDVQSLPSLPNIKNRQEDTMYSYRYSGRDIIVRWQQKGKYISWSCDLSSPSACKGGLRLDRCPSIQSSWSLGAPAQHRP
jgi:hypothetical protein